MEGRELEKLRPPRWMGVGEKEQTDFAVQKFPPPQLPQSGPLPLQNAGCSLEPQHLPLDRSRALAGRVGEEGEDMACDLGLLP